MPGTCAPPGSCAPSLRSIPIQQRRQEQPASEWCWTAGSSGLARIAPPPGQCEPTTPPFWRPNIDYLGWPILAFIGRYNGNAGGIDDAPRSFSPIGFRGLRKLFRRTSAARLEGADQINVDDAPQTWPAEYTTGPFNFADDCAWRSAESAARAVPNQHAPPDKHGGLGFRDGRLLTLLLVGDVGTTATPFTRPPNLFFGPISSGLYRRHGDPFRRLGGHSLFLCARRGPAPKTPVRAKPGAL